MMIRAWYVDVPRTRGMSTWVCGYAPQWEVDIPHSGNKQAPDLIEINDTQKSIENKLKIILQNPNLKVLGRIWGSGCDHLIFSVQGPCRIYAHIVT